MQAAKDIWEADLQNDRKQLFYVNNVIICSLRIITFFNTKKTGFIEKSKILNVGSIFNIQNDISHEFFAILFSAEKYC